VKVPTFLLLRG